MKLINDLLYFIYYIHFYTCILSLELTLTANHLKLVGAEATKIPKLKGGKINLNVPYFLKGFLSVGNNGLMQTL